MCCLDCYLLSVLSSLYTWQCFSLVMLHPLPEHAGVFKCSIGYHLVCQSCICVPSCSTSSLHLCRTSHSTASCTRAPILPETQVLSAPFLSLQGPHPHSPPYSPLLPLLCYNWTTPDSIHCTTVLFTFLV